jgi:hypothetical protein
MISFLQCDAFSPTINILLSRICQKGRAVRTIERSPPFTQKLVFDIFSLKDPSLSQEVGQPLDYLYLSDASQGAEIT